MPYPDALITGLAIALFSLAVGSILFGLVLKAYIGELRNDRDFARRGWAQALDRIENLQRLTDYLRQEGTFTDGALNESRLLRGKDD